jgi:prepilin-type N-terminal cleavage/methylation domain-containing protein/prepilin-type processing-associated H-X9-DG protein
MSTSFQRQGFTLSELLVVLGITGILLGLLMAAVQHVRTAAIRAQCLNNLRQIGLALHGYHDATSALPPGMSYQNGTDPYPYMSWEVHILPYVEQSALWHQAEEAYVSVRDPFHNSPPHLLSTVVRLYGCPADDRTMRAANVTGELVAFTSYLGVEGKSNRFLRRNGILFRDSHVRFTDVTDGCSTTIMVGERPPSADLLFGWWYAGVGQNGDGSGDVVLSAQELNLYYDTCPPGPYNYGPGSFTNQCDMFHFWSPHAGGANFVFADGSARFLSYSAAAILPAMASRDGGESVPPPE